MPFLATLYISRTEHENNFEDYSTGDVRNLLVTYFPSPLDESFSKVSTILIINELCIGVSLG